MTAEFAPSWLRRALVIVVAVKVAGLILIFDPASAQAFDGTKAALSLAVTWCLLALIGLAVLQFGFGIFPTGRLHLAVAIFALANVVAALFAQDRYIAVFGAQRHLGLVFVLDMIVLYAAVTLAFRSGKDWSILGAAVGCSGLVAIAYGFGQYAGLDPIPWAEFSRQRPPSTFGNADKFGHFLGTTFVAAVALVLVLSERDVRGNRIFALLYAAAAIGAIGVIATRGTLLGIGAAVPALGAIYFRLYRGLALPRMIVGVVGAAVGVALLGGVALFATPLGERVRSGFTDVATQQRVFIADAALRAALDRPISGHGPDNFGVIYPRYRAPSSVAAGGLVNQDSAHSWLLQAAATTGALGTGSLVVVAVMTLVLLWRALATSPRVAAPLFVGAVAYWAGGLVAIGSPSVDWIGWTAAGAAATFGRRGAVTRPRGVAPLVPALALVAVLFLTVAAFPALQASRELNVARAAQQAGRADRAIPPAERAVELDPGRGEHWYALGLARQDRGMFGGAAEAFRGATERAPYVSAYWSSLSLAIANLVRAGDSSLGGAEAALAAARRGIEADPYSPAPHYVLALVANGLGEHAVALDAAALAIGLSKGESGYEAVAAEAALRLPDSRAARSALERLVAQRDSPVLRVALARLSLKLGDPQTARDHLRRALELDPQNAPARELLAQLGT